MQTSLIDQGLNLMLFGMGTVFVFLTVLVFATTVMSKLVAKFAPVESPAAPEAKQTAVATQASPEVLSAIKLAIEQHRQR